MRGPALCMTTENEPRQSLIGVNYDIRIISKEERDLVQRARMRYKDNYYWLNSHCEAVYVFLLRNQVVTQLADEL